MSILGEITEKLCFNGIPHHLSKQYLVALRALISALHHLHSPPAPLPQNNMRAYAHALFSGGS